MALERFLLIPDWKVALARMAALWILITDVWPEISSSESERGEWIEGYRGRHLSLGTDDHGHYVLDDPAAAKTIPDSGLPAELVDLLVQEVLDRPEDERIVRGESVRDLMVEWNRCLVDSEKLMGHLFLGHQDTEQLSGQSYEDLVGRHSEMHRET